MTQRYKIIAIDADDTLWDCQSHFEAVENQLYSLIAPYCDVPAKELLATEQANMADLGYGCKAFTISVVETAIRVGAEHLSIKEISNLLQAGKALLHLPATPLPGVEETLRTLRERVGSGIANPRQPNIVNSQQLANPGQIKIVCFTKGELQDQENKLRRSGLLKYFDDVEITSDKTQHEFLRLCDRLQIHPSEMVMIGNSLKSDIAPALAIGAWAIHIPFHVTWQLEQFEEFDHERLLKVKRFSDILNYL